MKKCKHSPNIWISAQISSNTIYFVILITESIFRIAYFRSLANLIGSFKSEKQCTVKWTNRLERIENYKHFMVGNFHQTVFRFILFLSFAPFDCRWIFPNCNVVLLLLLLIELLLVLPKIVQFLPWRRSNLSLKKKLLAWISAYVSTIPAHSLSLSCSPSLSSLFKHKV